MSVTVNKSYADGGSYAPFIKRIELAWVSDASGNATVAVEINGLLIAASFIPGTGGSQPTNNYAAVFNDPDGIDILSGLGAALSNTTKAKKCPVITASDGTNTTYIPGGTAGQHTLNVSGAGDTKSGKVVLYFR